jgi:hypothetical protein
MSRQLTALHRASFALGALLITWGVAPHAVAADQAQRVAMACTQASDAGCKHISASSARHTMHAQRDSAAAKAPAQRAQATRTVAALDNDGSRFRYDSCGCSND